MKVKLDNGKEYLVIWQHVTPQQSKETKVPVGTACTIYQIVPGEKVIYANIRLRKYISPKWVKEHPKNQFSKESGRRFTLDRVLHDRTNFNRRERTLFWDAYHNRGKVHVDELTLQDIEYLEEVASHVSDNLKKKHDFE